MGIGQDLLWADAQTHGVVLVSSVTFSWRADVSLRGEQQRQEGVTQTIEQVLDTHDRGDLLVSGQVDGVDQAFVLGGE